MTKMLLNHTLLPDSLSRGFFRNGVEVPDIENASSIDSQLRFLERKDLYSTEKPYSMRYRPKNGFSPSNLVFAAHDVTVRDMRPLLPALSLDVNGFEVHKMQTSLSRNDFDDYHTVHAGYIRKLEQYVKKIRGAAHVHALDYELRKRHEIFPLSTGEEYAFGQPAMSVHVDITLQSARSIVRELYGDHAEEILESRLEVVTAWKPIIGPVRDWPLALCDSRTIDRRSDVIPADAVYRKFVAENCMVHHNHDQRWYYLRDQEIDELLLFKATDSDLEKSIVCAHGAFDLGANTAQPPRESIDVRMLVMYANIGYPETNAWSL